MAPSRPLTPPAPLAATGRGVCAARALRDAGSLGQQLLPAALCRVSGAAAAAQLPGSCPARARRSSRPAQPSNCTPHQHPRPRLLVAHTPRFRMRREMWALILTSLVFVIIMLTILDSTTRRARLRAIERAKVRARPHARARRGERGWGSRRGQGRWEGGEQCGRGPGGGILVTRAHRTAARGTIAGRGEGKVEEAQGPHDAARCGDHHAGSGQRQRTRQQELVRSLLPGPRPQLCGV